MKRKLLALVCVMVGSTMLLRAQTFQGQELTVKKSATAFLDLTLPSPQHNEVSSEAKSTVCTDQVRYGDKGPAQAGGDVGGYFWGVAQVFPFYTGNVTGAAFNGNSLTGSLNVSDSFLIAVYDVMYDSFFDTYVPTGGPMGFAFLTSVTSATQDYSVTFASPIAITNPDGFAIMVASAGSGDSINVNMSPNNSAQGGHLSFAYGGGNAYSLYMGGYDSDLMIYPTISFTQITVGLTASTNSICENASVNFTNTPSVTIPYWYETFYAIATGNPLDIFNTSITNNQLWSYDYGDGSPLSYSNTQSPSSHLYTTVGSYDAELALNYQGYVNNCKSTSIETIEVGGPPTGSFSWQSTGLSVQFNELTQGATTFSWNFGDAGASSAPNPIHNYVTSGSYTVELTASNSCGSTLMFMNITISDTTNSGNVGVENITVESAISMYPNPTTGKLHLTVSENNMSVVVVDLLGKIVHEESLLKGENIVDLRNEAKGMYMVNVLSSEGTVLSQKVIIE